MKERLQMDPLSALYFLGVQVPFYATLTAAILSSIISATFVIGLFAAVVIAFIKFRLCYGSSRAKSDVVTVGFFHPYCDAGGGGERVLWCAIKAMSKRYPKSCKFIVYTGDIGSAPDQILARAKARFQIDLSEVKVEFVYLHQRMWVEARTFPRFTLIGQSMGSLILGYEALTKYCPDVFIDTMGYAFTLPLFKLFGGCRTACYVHYPTISTDMLDKVRTRTLAHNNRSFISNSRVLSRLKLLYYKCFALIYGFAGGRFSDLTMVNSSWTEGHISELWGGGPGDKNHREDDHRDSSSNVVIHKVYPPCDTTQFAQLPLSSEELMESDGPIKIVSVGQFRPEKDHALQIRAMFELRQIVDDAVWKRMKLVLIGGCRNAEDEKRVRDLKDLCGHMSVEDNVEFKTNIPFEELKVEMSEALVGVHTMWNEHFGIAVVEMLAAGLVTVAHRSGGPLMDIVIEATDGDSRNGFLAVSEREYAAAIAHAATLMTPESRRRLIERARDSVKRFSDQEFEKAWLRTTDPLISNCMAS